MGQARRRKLAGNYPIPAEDFVTPAGTVAITVDIEGTPPSTMVFDAAKIGDVETEMRRLVVGLPYYSAVRGFAERFVDARKKQNDTDLTAIGLGVLWTAFNHPQLSDQMRRLVSAALRRDGKAHITWHFSTRHGLGLAVDSGFVDLAPAAALAPKDKIFVYAPPANDVEQSH